MKKSIFKEGKKYTFSDYFDLNYPTEEIVEELGYSFSLEVITLPESEDDDDHLLYGAITIGEIWRFATLNRQAKHLTRDIHSYRIPEDMEQLFRVLFGIVGCSL